jgi:hypothetical protein
VLFPIAKIEKNGNIYLRTNTPVMLREMNNPEASRRGIKQDEGTQK